MRIVHTALFGIAALLCAATAVQSQQQNMAAVDPAPPTADAAPTADAVSPPPAPMAAPAAAAPATATPAAAAPAATPAPAAAKAAAPAAKPPQKSAALEPKKKVYRPALIPADPDNVDSDGIAATVNDISVSEFELRQRMSLFLATAGIQQASDEEKKRIRGQILEQLENEKLQLQEAIKKHITVSPAEVDNQINHMVTDNHLTIEQLREVLINAGSSEQALRTQITAQIAWEKTVSQEYQDRINISPADVDAEMARYAEGADKPHYLVSEIFFPVDNPDKDAEAHKTALSVEEQLKTGGNFALVARQFSQSPSAASGGDIGWVHEGQLAPELNAALTKMTVNTLSPPIRSIGGYYIISLRARQEPLGTKIAAPQEAATGPDSTLPLARLLLPLGANPSKDVITSAMKIAVNLRNAYSGCEMLEKMPAQLSGAVYMNLGNMKVGDLSPEIQKALAATHSGEAAMPFVSDAGIELIGRCDKKVVVQTAYVMPTRQDVENQLFQQQISAMARRYMRTLRRGVDVEVR
ncbi:MAG: peptidylprolyl isomerase [Proteobacteria bacterium]|nr:peptidylprolyl isomerase [Pseudomonadota bacterium]